jgi:SNF family Na+-dependent transporter
MEVSKAHQPQGDTRERWSSRLAFYFAAVGSAVGFGNVWRFPSLVYEYGGGAFFIPYVLALFLIGIPLLVLEISLGQYYETGDVGVFGSIHRRLRGVGVSSIACGYMLVTYYSMLLAWVCNAFFDSFGSNNFWAQAQVTGSEAKDYFYNVIIGMGTLDEDLRPTRLVGKNVGYSFLTWAVIYCCVAFGVKTTGRITYVTMGLPVILLFVFLGRALTLPGSDEGVDAYIHNSNWNMLTERPEVWSKAVSQIFFSLSVTFGIMTAYGSHCHRTEPAFVNSCVVAISNCLFSFVAGFAVFATLGHLSLIENLESISQLEYSSFGLVFGSWPVALGTLPGGEHWIRLLFVMLFLLGIDSAFSFMEGFLTVLGDTKAFHKVDRKITSFVLAMTAFLLSLMYATDAGLIFLDTIDYYINFVMLLVGGFECFAAGWVYKIENQIENLGAAIVFSHMCTYFGAFILACCLWFGLSNAADALWAGFAGLVGFYVLGMSYTAFLMNKKMQENPGRWTWNSMTYELMFKNIADLKSDLSSVVGYLPFTWNLLVKFFIPPVILILFGLSCDAENADGTKVFGHYSGYVFSPYQILGILCVVFTGFLFLSSLVAPRMYSALQRPEIENKTSVHAAPKDMKGAKEDFEVDVEQDGVYDEATNAAEEIAIEA